jgi:hypothetical protein
MQFISRATMVAGAVALALAACGGGSDDGHGRWAGYVDNVVNPEDMVRVPGTSYVITSTDQTPGKTKPGYLYLADARTSTAVTTTARMPASATRGDPACASLPFSTWALNGLALRPGTNGHHQLLAVNRGGRMSIELFDVDATSGTPVITWNGCVLMPDKAFPNDLVPIANDGFAVTVSYETDNARLIDQLEKQELTGYLLEWTASKGFVLVPGSELSFNNGVEVDPDGRNYYISAWGSKALLRLPSSTGSGQPLLAGIGIRPDNITWSSAGTLIVAGHDQSPTALFACVGSGADVCPVPFKIIEVDPKTMGIVRVLVDGTSMDTYAGATTGLEVGNEIWASSFRYGKIARYLR